MGNEEYQWLLRSRPEVLRDRLVGEDYALRVLLEDLTDAEVSAALRDLGGHDLVLLDEVFAQVAETGRRSCSPTPSRAAACRSRATRQPLRAADRRAVRRLRCVPGDVAGRPVAGLRPVVGPGAVVRGSGRAAAREPVALLEPPAVPAELGRAYRGLHSTQATLGRVLTDLARDAPDVAARVVTVSPDVASSTNTGGWINKVGVWSAQDRRDWFAEDGDRLVRWRETSSGQHIELGIAETNLVGLLGELGSTWSTLGQPLLPIGTVYDPFVARALEPWVFGTYGGGQSVLVGTPSGVTLAAEGGAHQSITTPSIGLETPGVTAYEPAFAVEAEWCLLDALSRLGRPGGESAYLRLTTRPLDQELCALPDDAPAREQRRRDVLAGGYRLRSASAPDVALAVVGAAVPEALEAADLLAAHGVQADVSVVTSYDRLWRCGAAAPGAAPGSGTASTRACWTGCCGRSPW
jgi:pyruvate dehydrogenase E1 component